MTEKEIVKDLRNLVVNVAAFSRQRFAPRFSLAQ